MTHEHDRYTPTLLERAAATDAAADFTAAHDAFTEMLQAADQNTLKLPADERLEQQVRDAWARYECILEAERAMRVLEAEDIKAAIDRYDLIPRYKKFLETDRFLLEQCGTFEPDARHLLMIGSGPLPISSYIFGKSNGGFGYEVTNVDTSAGALETGQKILAAAGLDQRFAHASGADVIVDPSVTAVIVAALAGTDKADKLAIIKNVAAQLQPGARISVRYGSGVRLLFYPEGELTDAECDEYNLRRIGGFEPPRDYMNAIGVYEKC